MASKRVQEFRKRDSLPRRKRFLFLSLPVLLCLGIAGLVMTICFQLVDLKPKVDETFFFSKNDPQVRADDQIEKLFPEPDQIILVATGDIRSPAYAHRLQMFTEELERVPGVSGIQSLSRGPKNIDDALKSDLWTRLLISKNQKSSYIFLTLKKNVGEETMRRLETIQRRFDSPGFKLAMSGIPYVTELIARNLARDLRVFTLAAICIFGVILLVVFRSPWIVLGTFVACAISSASTLIVTQLVHIPIGPLTANLSTMVFVMTLSPMVFLTFNWKRIRGEREIEERDAVWEAVKETVAPSFWSATCMFLGFISLLFVESTPMRHLGIAGAIGATMALAAAYGIYPWFLKEAPATSSRPAGWMKGLESHMNAFFAQRHGRIVAGLAVFTVIGAIGLLRLNTDPDLPSYFKEGGDIRSGLDYVDKTGGSSPLYFVVEDKQHAPLNTKEAYKRLWGLQEDLEKDHAVGNVESLPVVLSEAKRPWFSIFLSTEKEIKILDQPKYGEISSQLITSDRNRTLYVLRMKETGRKESRREVINHLKSIVHRNGFHTVLLGGTYNLLDQMTQLVTSSIISGVLLLIGIFVVMGFAFSRSLKVAAAMLVSLTVIPVVVRGYIAYLGMPLDFITASAANLDLGMGVDAMIYLTMFTRRAKRSGDSWSPWSKACAHLWQPIATSLLVICCGFGIFLLSNFPPTQRFGLFVIFGSATAAAVALFMFPYLASISRRAKTLDRKRAA
ncbi:MAG TPA: MMPL family transporter [Candidatus Angelobacter sp.]